MTGGLFLHIYRKILIATLPQKPPNNLCMAKYKFNNDIRRLAIAAFTDDYYSQTA